LRFQLGFQQYRDRHDLLRSGSSSGQSVDMMWTCLGRRERIMDVRDSCWESPFDTLQLGCVPRFVEGLLISPLSPSQTGVALGIVLAVQWS